MPNAQILLCTHFPTFCNPLTGTRAEGRIPIASQKDWEEQETKDDLPQVHVSTFHLLNARACLLNCHVSKQIIAFDKEELAHLSLEL